MTPEQQLIDVEGRYGAARTELSPEFAGPLPMGIETVRTL